MAGDFFPSDDPKSKLPSIDDDIIAYPLDKMRSSQKVSKSTVTRQEHAGRIPPQALEVEQSVLGAMLIEAEAIPEAIEILSEDSFYEARHRHIYRAISNLFERSIPADLVTVADELRRLDLLEAIGGSFYLSELTTKVASAANIEYHARIVAEKSLLRQLIETMTGVITQAFEPAADAFDLLDAAENAVFQISQNQLRNSTLSMAEIIKDVVVHLQSIHGLETGVTGVPSGFHALDGMTGGWQNSDLIIIAARPSMGKTAFSLSIMRNAALNPRKPTPVAIFSLEMSSAQLAQRLLTAEARIDAQAARTGKLSDDDWPEVARAAGRLSQAPIFIDDTPGLGVLELRAKCRRLKAEHNIGLVVVDYLQLMHGTKNAGSREQEIAQISRSLKMLAKELDIPIIALSQLSRAVETRGGDKRPQLADLRESGCLTADTRILRADTNAWVSLGELLQTNERNIPVWTLDAQLQMVQGCMTHVFPSGVKPVFALKLRSGREIKASANHPFLCLNGWTQLADLKKGDRLAIPRRIGSPAQEQVWPATHLILLAHCMGNACLENPLVLRYPSTDAQNIQAACDAIQAFGMTAKVTTEASFTILQPLAPDFFLHGQENPLETWLEEVGLFGQQPHETFVPPAIFQLTKSQIALFLRHLWANNGQLMLKPNEEGHPSVAHFAYTTPSRRFAEDLCHLLLRFGIVGRIQTFEKPSAKPIYTVEIQGHAFQQCFIDHIAPCSRDLEAARVSLSQIASNQQAAALSFMVWAQALAQPQGIQSLPKAVGIKPFSLQARLTRIAQMIQNHQWQSFSHSDVFWDEVEEILPLGEQPVFDATVLGTHNFVADGILVHNSIEQDADLVAFIYRAEKYGIPVDESGQSTEGVAELIIGKQRNGPIGSVRLAFVNRFARFENLTTYFGGDEGGGGYFEPPNTSGDGYGGGSNNLPDAPF